MIKLVLSAVFSAMLSCSSPNYFALAQYEYNNNSYYISFNKPNDVNVDEIRFYYKRKVVKVFPAWDYSGTVGIDEHKLHINKSIVDIEKVERIELYSDNKKVNTQMLIDNKTIEVGPDKFYFYKSKKN